MGVLRKRAVDAAAAELAANVVSYALGVRAQNIVDDARGCTKTAYARQLAADSDEFGHRFQSEIGHRFQFEIGRRTTSESANWRCTSVTRGLS